MHLANRRRQYVLIVSLVLLVTLIKAIVWTQIPPSSTQGTFVPIQGYSTSNLPHLPRANNTVLFIHGINKYSQLDCNGDTT